MKNHHVTIFIGTLSLIAILTLIRVSSSFAETGNTSFLQTNDANVVQALTSSGASGTSATSGTSGGTITTITTIATTTTTLANPITSTTPLLKQMAVDPERPVVEIKNKISFKVKLLSGDENLKVEWAVLDPNGGVIGPDGVYTAPSFGGMFRVGAKVNGYFDRIVAVTVKVPEIKVETTTTIVPTTTFTNTTAVVNNVPVTTSVIPVTTTAIPVKIVEPIKVTEPVKTVTPVSTANATIATTSATTVKPAEPVKVAVPVKVVEPVRVAEPVRANTTLATTTRVENKGETPKQVTNSSSTPGTASSVSSTTLPMVPIGAPVRTIPIEIREVAAKVDDIKTTVTESRESFIKIIDQRIADVATENKLPENASTTAALKAVREKLQNDLESSITGETVTAPEKIRELGNKISDSLDEINRIAPKLDDKGKVATSSEPSRQADKALEALVTTIEQKAGDLQGGGSDLLYKDTNKDGISDYDSVHLYDIDPVKPSPVTVIDGREVTAGEKVLLGLDPSTSQLVKIEPEQPKVSLAPVEPAYKVTNVKLAPETKKVVLTGQALPNSFVTIYIYSTPITVTVKTDSEGEWHYTLDKELETGEHSVYTASVNNSGKILARSSEFTFVKTAEAATLDTVPSGVQASADVVEPTVVGGNNIYLIIVALFAMLLVAIGLIGVTVR